MILTKQEAEQLLIESSVALNRLMSLDISTVDLLKHRQMVKQIKHDYPELYKSIINIMNRVDQYVTACFYERHPEYAPKQSNKS